MKEAKGIALQAILWKLASNPGGGWRITFDVPQSDHREVIKLSGLFDTNLSLGVVAENPNTIYQDDDEILSEDDLG